MRVIFLDIDGVLNCKGTPNLRKFPYVVDRTLLTRFKRLVDRTDAHVVLSSTWRCDPIGILAAEHLGIPFHDLCPDNPKCARDQEIRQWLREHPEVERFAVLDDECDGLDGLPLFQPSDQTGLTKKMAEGIAEYLEGKTGKTMRRAFIIRLGQNVRSFFKRNKS